MSIAGVMSTDLLPAGVRSFRICALVGGLVPIGLALGAGSLDLSRSVGLVFAVSAATLCPLLLLGVWWRGLTPIGAIAGLAVGGLTSIAAVVTVVGDVVDETALDGWLGVIADYPAAVTVPLTFATMILVSLATRTQIPPRVNAIFAAMHVPERLGLGVERTP